MDARPQSGSSGPMNSGQDSGSKIQPTHSAYTEGFKVILQVLAKVGTFIIYVAFFNLSELVMGLVGFLPKRVIGDELR